MNDSQYVYILIGKSGRTKGENGMNEGERDKQHLLLYTANLMSNTSKIPNIRFLSFSI
jgi:hypothetical protein